MARKSLLKGSLLGRTMIMLGTIALVVWVGFPFYWLIITSLKPRTELFLTPPSWFPAAPEWSRYQEIWSFLPLGRYMLNSIIVTVLTVILSVFLTSTAAYALSRFQFRGKTAFLGMLLFTQLVPGVITVIPLYFVLYSLGLLNNYFGLVIAYSTGAIPFSTLMLRSYFKSAYPPELEESALIDGCSRLGAFVRICLPLSRPGLAAVATMNSINAWKEFMFSSIIMTKGQYRTLAVGLRSMVGEFGLAYIGEFMTASVVACLPILIAFLFMQKSMVEGLSSGAVKG
ncbi:MAG: carbohydrate ABC transporter permease [Firmicutes bacterium]|jgi:multiple sugar transport system permease protein|nr:carbohydrate ABC transporter permease [Bacillota bacterium]